MRATYYMILVAIVLLFTQCGAVQIRYDGAPSPLDENHHTLLMEADCPEGAKRGFGQVGCSYGANETVAGQLTVHTPLPGSIRLYSKECEVNMTEFHGDAGGSFAYDLTTLFPAAAKSCVVDVYVMWQLPKTMSSDYPVRGMSGRLYLRRRPEGSKGLGLRWSNQVNFNAGLAYNQVTASVTRDPKGIELRSSAPVKDGSYRLYGCGKGVEKAPIQGDAAGILLDTLLNGTGGKSRCVYYGWIVGQGPDSWVDEDAMVGLEVYGPGVQHLAASLTVENGSVCYETESTVSLAVFNYGNTNKASNKLRDCFKIPANGKARLGLFTHKGRAYYAIIEGGQVKEVLQ